jgi:DNA-binding response OmpR family regulator
MGNSSEFNSNLQIDTNTLSAGGEPAAVTMRTLIIDNDKNTRIFLEEILTRQGHAVSRISNGEEALNLLRDTSFQLVILDIKLAGRVDGLRVLKAVRWRWPETVVIILTAHASLESTLAAIQDGVDGYLVKPVTSEQILKAIQNAFDIRRKRLERALVSQKNSKFTYGPFSIDPQKYQASMNGEMLELTLSEFKLLEYLIQNAERVVSPIELVEAVQGYEPENLREARRIIKWYIYRLRQKIEVESSNPRYIQNVRGVGYILEA